MAVLTAYLNQMTQTVPNYPNLASTAPQYAAHDDQPNNLASSYLPAGRSGKAIALFSPQRSAMALVADHCHEVVVDPFTFEPNEEGPKLAKISLETLSCRICSADKQRARTLCKLFVALRWFFGTLGCLFDSLLQARFTPQLATAEIRFQAADVGETP